MVNFRPATPDDADFLVPLINESSGGVWPAVWKALAKEMEETKVAGARYLSDTDNDLSIKNTVLVESEGMSIGAMTSYREKCISPSELASTPTLLPVELDKALQPYRELCDPNSLFVAEICFLPEARGKGLGTRLLQHAVNCAIEQKLPRVTLRVFSINTGALRLYERFGFRIVDQRDVLPHPDIKVGGLVYSMAYNIV